MTLETSVAMTSATEEGLVGRLDRDDGQEDICLATYRPSTGKSRLTALISDVIPPGPGEREVHGNATITAEYILRAAEIARDGGDGLVLLHSHPGADRWQMMSIPDRDAEAGYAHLVRELTGLPLVGMTLATGSLTWSARHWNEGVGRQMNCTHSTNVRVIGNSLSVSWNDVLRAPPRITERQVRTLSSWGELCQADLARRRILVVGAGSVGLDIIVRLAASGLCQITVMDFDIVEFRNLDRLIGAKPRDARLKRPKIHVASREAIGSATSEDFHIEVSDSSICEPDGLKTALDHDLIFSCVDRPWPRAVLNALAYSDLIPVIDGGICIDTFDNGRMRNATWRSHVIRPDRPCMSCNGQLELGEVSLDRDGLWEDPKYIERAGITSGPVSQNVAPLSVNVTASLLSQYVSYSVAPANFGDPGPLQYALSTHQLDRLACPIRPHCPIESAALAGDQRIDLTGRHVQAERQRELANNVGVRVRSLRWIDDVTQGAVQWLDRVRI